ncbi:MAG: 3-oxoadipate enol-lactonase [Dehalococcoidia bacterium]
MPVIRVRDVDLFYTDEGDGEPVLFIHGLTWDHTLFDAQVAALRDQYRCIAVDLIGHGQSGDLDRDYSFFDLADYMHALLDALGIDSAHVAGLSMGGMTAMPLALTHPERVRSLILLDTDAGPEAPERAASYEQLAAIALQQGWAPVAEPVVGILFGAPFLADPGHKQWAIEKLSSSRPEGVARALRTVVTREGILDRLGTIGVPTTVIVGELDVATTPDKAEAMAVAIPGATLVRIPEAGHHSPIEQPHAVTAAIAAHLERAAVPTR